MALRRLLVLGLAFRGINAVAEPLVTAAAVLEPRQQSVLGWYSAVDSTGSTHWNLQTIPGSVILTTKGSIYDFCKQVATAPCWIYTGCVGSYVLATASSATSFYCGAYSTCMSDFLYPSSGAALSQRMTNYYCIATPATPYTYYYTSPNSAGGVSTVSPTGQPASQPNKAVKSKAPIGAIVGGVIGGLAVLGIAIGAIIFLCCRAKRNKKNSTVEASDATTLSSVPPAPVGYTSGGFYGKPMDSTISPTPEKGGFSPSTASYLGSPGGHSSMSFTPQPNNGSFVQPPQTHTPQGYPPTAYPPPSAYPPSSYPPPGPGYQYPTGANAELDAGPQPYRGSSPPTYYPRQ